MITSTLTNKGALKSLTSLIAIIPLLWFCSIPLGNTLRSIFFVICLSVTFLQYNALKDIKMLLSSPWFITLLLAIAWSTLTLTWAPAWNHETKFYFNKLLLLTVLPIIVVNFKLINNKKSVLDCFLLTMIIPFSLAILKRYFGWQWHGDNDPGSLFYNHIITGLYTTFAAFLAIEMYFKYKKTIYLMAWAIFSFQVLGINTGKMSYILYLMIMSFSFWLRTPKSMRWAIVIGLPCLMYVLFLLSPAIQDGIQLLSNDWQQFQHGQLNTSLGFRIQFHQFAYQQFTKHWLVGNGLGSYDYWFKILNPVPGWPYAPNTHSQIWFFLSDTGLIGLLLWASFFTCLIIKARTLGWHGHIMLGYLIIFLFNCFSDNLLFASPASLLIALWAFVLKSTETS